MSENDNKTDVRADAAETTDRPASAGILGIEAFAVAASQGRPLLGIDPGSKTLGLALSDSRHTIASPLVTVKRTKFTQDAAELVRLAGGHKVCGLVVGLPLNMDGSEGPRAQSVRAFLRNLAPLLPLPVLLWDERLSSIAAERALLEADASRKRRGEVIDKMAAAYILQGALDRLAQLRKQKS
jgi:putative Holliday junction resolvase